MMSADSKNIGIILLAAGGSSRLGRPKQLLLHAGQTLLQHCLQTAMASGANPVVVVLGAYADLMKSELDRKAHVVVNPDWQEGLASSIRHGVRTLTKMNPSAAGAILMMCDQPHVTTALLNELITAYQNSGKVIVTCSYENTFGPPTFFHKRLFPKLLQLKGDVGARSIIRQHADEAEIISFPEGGIDVDTENDYQELSKVERLK